MFDMQQFRVITICKQRWLYESRQIDVYEWGNRVFRSFAVKFLG